MYESKLAALADSLALGQDRRSTYQRVLLRFANELGAIRATLAPEYVVLFDWRARVWLREQARQGYQVAVPRVTPRHEGIPTTDQPYNSLPARGFAL